MPQDNQAVRAFYDHEIDEEPRTGGRRRRPAADWGVGEDIFDRMPSPSRRFSHPRDEDWESAPRTPSPASEWHEDEAARERRFAKRAPRERQVETWDDDAVAAWG